MPRIARALATLPPPPPAPDADLVCLDPGVRNAGLAVYRAGVLAGLVSISLGGDVSPEDTAARLLLHLPANVSGFRLIVEWPRRYQRNRRAWPEVDALRAVARALEDHAAGPPLDAWASTHRIAPGTWGRTVPKHIRAQRTARALGAVVCARVGWDRHGPDARDAAGLGLWALETRPWERPGRFEEGG